MRRRPKAAAAPSPEGEPPAELLTYDATTRGPRTGESFTRFLAERDAWRRKNGRPLGVLMARDRGAVIFNMVPVPDHLAKAEDLERTTPLRSVRTDEELES